VDTVDLIVFQIIDKTIRNSKFRCLSEATSYYHNVFTFTLFLPEWRAGVALEPSNKIILFLPRRKIKCLSLHPLISSLNLLFIYPSHLSFTLTSSVSQTSTRCGQHTTPCISSHAFIQKKLTSVMLVSGEAEYISVSILSLETTFFSFLCIYLTASVV
jgi:hypothetical protein